MVKINKKIEYALMILKHMSASKQLYTAKELCDLYSIPFDTASKVLQLLNRNKIVRSTKGINGGYSLTIDLSQINYLSLSEIIEGKKHSKNCCEDNCSLISTCNITGPITSINKHLYNFFESLTLDQLFDEAVKPIKKTLDKVNIHELN